MELNHFAIGHGHFRLESFFFSQNRKNWKTFFELLLGILSDLRETWHVHSSAGPDLVSYQKNFAQLKNVQIINKQISLACYKNVNCLISRSN